jgi:CHAT domain-containing protein
MAALYDGSQYLIEKYNIALTPGLQLLDPQPLQRQDLRVLTGGLTESRQGFPPLPGVEIELQKINAEVPSQLLLNQDLTNMRLENKLETTPFNVVHLATHGQFSSNADETFILTWDDRLKVRDFSDLLRNRAQNDTTPLELLVLSACQTASGDERAALGLAGVAVRSGARSTVATLWSVSDEAAAALMVRFYQELTQPGMTKAEALRRAQVSLLKQEKFRQPFYWSPFVLIGNWVAIWK